MLALILKSNGICAMNENCFYHTLISIMCTELVVSISIELKTKQNNYTYKSDWQLADTIQDFVFLIAQYQSTVEKFKMHSKYVQTADLNGKRKQGNGSLIQYLKVDLT